MLESIIVLMEKIYLVCFLLVHVCVIGIKGVRNFVTNMILAFLFSTVFSLMTWYANSDKWFRLGKPLEGTESYLIGFLGWVAFVCLFSVFGVARVAYKATFGVRSYWFTLANIIFWIDAGLLLFSIQATILNLFEVPETLRFISFMYFATGSVSKFILHFTEREDK